MNKSGEEEHIVTFEEFSKIHLKIGKIIQAEIIAGMEKILKVKVDVGTDQRDLVVGAALFYRPEELIGKKVVVCTNLKPRKIADIRFEWNVTCSRGNWRKARIPYNYRRHPNWSNGSLKD